MMVSFLSPFRRRSCLFVLAGAVLIPFTILLLIIGPDLTAEQTLAQKLAEFQMRVQYLESMYRTKQEDVSILTQYLGLTASAASSGNGSNGEFLKFLQANIFFIFLNIFARHKWQ